MSWYRNLNTQNKLLFVFTLFTLAATFTAGVSIITALRLGTHIHAIQRQAQNLSQVNAAQADFLDAQIASKNFLLTGEPYYQGQYRRFDAELADYARQALVEAQTVDGREDLSTLNNDRTTYTNSINEAFTSVQGRPEPSSQTDPSLINTRNEDDSADRVRAHFNNMAYKSELELGALVANADRQVMVSAVLGIISLALISGLVILAAGATNQIAEPVLYLTNACVAFENNTFDPSLLHAYTRRPDELGRLAASFSGMAQSITAAVCTKDQYLNAAARFIPTQYLDFLEKDSIIDIKLGDHVSAEMAVMFSDVRGFTTLSENMTPQQNFDFVNEYLEMVSPIVQRHDGFIVKFLGDGMMAVFPYGVDDAVRAGIEKQREVINFNQKLEKRGLPPVQVGIGIHTGHMMVGMIGEEMRMQGDAFSDNVNLTSRVEGLTKYYGVSMIISEETLLRLERPVPYQMRFLGKVQVKGRDTPITLYDIFDGEPHNVVESKQAIKDDFERGLNFYIKGNFVQARACFETVLKQYPEDKAAALYLQRSIEWVGRGAPEAWDGVEVMVSK